MKTEMTAGFNAGGNIAPDWACKLCNVISMVHPLQVIHIAGDAAYIISKNVIINWLVIIYYYNFIIQLLLLNYYFIPLFLLFHSYIIEFSYIILV